MTPEARSALVVLLEDDPRSADALQTLLSDWGFECLRGETLGQILPALRDRAGEVRALISDYHLPDGATGVEAAQALEAIGIAPPTLLLTGTLRGSARRIAAAAGYVFMDKPASADRLRRWLHQATAHGG